MSSLLLPIAYLPPVSYLSECKSAAKIIIEQHEHFVKQTIRNRCEIYGPNGKQLLVVPVIHENLFRTPVNKVKISYAERWNKIHWRSIEAAYRNAPYFEYFENELAEIFKEPGEYLFEFNLRLLKIIFKYFKIEQFHLSDEFLNFKNELEDLRLRDWNKDFSSVQNYHQVFQERHGFINNLSCIDKLFNTALK